jgi:hypothetical protein
MSIQRIYVAPNQWNMLSKNIVQIKSSEKSGNVILRKNEK